MLKLAYGLSFAELYERDGLARLDAAFLGFLEASDSALKARLLAARENPAGLAAKAESALILEIAPHLDDFLAELFGIQAEFRALAARHHELAPLYAVKRQFVQRRAANRIKPDEAAKLDGVALEAGLKKTFGGRFDELTFATRVAEWLADEAKHAAELELALKYAAWALHTPAGREHVRRGVLFKTPAKIDPCNLITRAHRSEREGVVTYTIKPEHIRRRRGFALTDPGTDLAGALDQANYCIWCHTQGKDS
ncbi:MAG TPA: hypothetical protein VEK81_05265, partial [Burkholderiales bacterium]|nr:hypothetical protein [Burkholderiales bacterium]